MTPLRILELFLVVLGILTINVQSNFTARKRKTPGTKPGKSDKKVYLFSISDNFSPMEYLNENKTLDGLNTIIIEDICTEAGKKCKLVVGPTDRCIDADIFGNNIPGRGILGGWFDACIGWGITQLRVNSLKFSKPYIRPADTFLYTKIGGSFNISDFSGQKIGFVKGFISSPDCFIGTIGKTDFERVVVDGLQDGINKLNDDTIDVLFYVTAGSEPLLDQMDRVDPRSTPRFVCYDGLGVFTRYDSDLTDWWNEAFEGIREKGLYTQNFCESAVDAYKTFIPRPITTIDVCYEDIEPTYPS